MGIEEEYLLILNENACVTVHWRRKQWTLLFCPIDYIYLPEGLQQVS